MAKLEALKSHPMIGNDFKKLKKDELQEVVDFVKNSEHLDDDDYASAVCRFKLDKPKSKNYSKQWSILIQCLEPKGRR